jgi:hypothetical protein
MSDYIYITVPEPVAVTNENGDVKVLTFFEFLKMRLLDPQHFGVSLATLEISLDLSKEFQGRSPGYVAKISKKEAKPLIASVISPTLNYIPEFALQLLPFMYAITKAPEERPIDAEKGTEKSDS